MYFAIYARISNAHISASKCTHLSIHMLDAVIFEASLYISIAIN